MRIRRRLLLLAGLPVLGLSLWGWWTGVKSVRDTRDTLEQLKAQRAELEQQNRALTREVEALRREAAARERAARELLGVASPDEVVVILPPPMPSPPVPATLPAERTAPERGVL